MFETPLPSHVWFLAAVQLLGVCAAIAAHRSTGTARQTFCQLLSLASMTIAGLAALLGSGGAPARCLICGTLFACMVLTATFDRCGVGLRPRTATSEY